MLDLASWKNKQPQTHKQRDHAPSAVVDWFFFTLVKNVQELFDLGGVIQVARDFHDGLPFALFVKVHPDVDGDGDDDAGGDAEEGNDEFGVHGEGD